MNSASPDALESCDARSVIHGLTNLKLHAARGATVIELAEKLLALAPVPMSKVWFASTGSEANDCAVRLAWYCWHSMGQSQK